MVLVQNHLKGMFDPKYIGDYRVVSLKGNQVEVQPTNGGPTEMKHIKHVKYILPANRYRVHRHTKHCCNTKHFCIYSLHRHGDS